jgi:tripartite ATP-independent transporter DctM subunit
VRLLNQAIRILDRVGTFSRWTNVVGIAILFLMVCLTFVDVVLRYVFNLPITGIVEVTEVLMIMAVFLAIAHTQNVKGHISIDLITSKLKPKARLVMECITTLIGLILFGVAVWQEVIQFLWFLERNSTHGQEYIMIPSAPFSGIIVIGCVSMALLLLRDFLANLAEALKLGLTRFNVLLIIGIPISVVALAILWMQPTIGQISLPSLGLIGILVSIILFLSGMPIAFVLLLTSVVFIGHIRGPQTALDLLGGELYSCTGTYTWSVLPFFVILGFVSLYAKFGEDLYHTAHQWFGHIRGGLAVATIGASTGFAAIVGESVSAIATMGAVALPEMRKYKYDDRLSTGSITGGSILGPIIPPSAAFIIAGLLTQMSIGDLFIAGIIPGVIMAVLYVITIYVWCRLNPKIATLGERTGWVPRLTSLKASGPVLVLFLLVIGGIYGGVFTPTEGGSVGAVVALIIGIAMRRFTWKTFAQTLIEAGKVISMVFLILIGAVMFTRFVAWCNVSNTLTELILSADLSPTAFVLLVLLVFFGLGWFIDLTPLLLIGIPIAYPIAVSLGVNTIWFITLAIITINLGALTPPVGISLFTLKGMAQDIPIGTIYKGSLPFVLGTVIAIAIVFAVPPCATWLPGLLK